ncbi:hypothetical protein NSK_004011 [Nannochloropsis salina CCMP1776]|uniref:Uncharacterized protein n=1 Tax=Nannochloropsis salina CCMP1776 TaxID=1027361 RepID=A0A4D9D527_9STRA|nr:hypothetical protein NSK_004011 [Nannochloropsis salina CCMP1776]|eukprot:TFJ84545.1 hypothetical protein NSK_004011 [Nannochloropsis salina CCMP1776]
MNTQELYRIAISYKTKLGPFATTRILNEYLKAVFRAPDLSSHFVEAMDLVVNQLLKVKDQELVDAIAEIAREVREGGREGGREGKREDGQKGKNSWGMTILLFTFERILPPALSSTQLEPLRRALGKALPGNVEDNMFELAKDAYSLGAIALKVGMLGVYDQWGRRYACTVLQLDAVQGAALVVPAGSAGSTTGDGSGEMTQGNPPSLPPSLPPSYLAASSIGLLGIRRSCNTHGKARPASFPASFPASLPPSAPPSRRCGARARATAEE